MAGMSDPEIINAQLMREPSVFSSKAIAYTSSTAQLHGHRRDHCPLGHLTLTSKDTLAESVHICNSQASKQASKQAHESWRVAQLPSWHFYVYICGPVKLEDETSTLLEILLGLYKPPGLRSYLKTCRKSRVNAVSVLDCLEPFDSMPVELVRPDNGNGTPDTHWSRVQPVVWPKSFR